MRLVIDAVGNKHSGGATVLLEILQAAFRWDVITETILLASPASVRKFELPASPRLRVIEVNGAESDVGRLLWAVVGLGKQLNTLEYDAFLGLNGMGGRSRGRASLIFIQQPIPYSPEALKRCSKARQMRMAVVRWLTWRSSKAADHVLVQNEAMRTTIAKAFDIPLERISAYLPTAPILPDCASKSPKLEGMRKETKGRAILYVGSAAPHKNLDVIFRGWPKVSGQFQARLYLTLPAKSFGSLDSSVVGLGTLNRGELYEAYKNATLVVMPSLAETVGLPMLEAMRVGTPVLVADRPYAHAVCEEAAVFFDPLSPLDFARKVEQLLGDGELRDRLKRVGLALIKQRDLIDPYHAMLKKIEATAKSASAKFETMQR